MPAENQNWDTLIQEPKIIDFKNINYDLERQKIRMMAPQEKSEYVAEMLEQYREADSYGSFVADDILKEFIGELTQGLDKSK